MVVFVFAGLVVGPVFVTLFFVVFVIVMVIFVGAQTPNFLSIIFNQNS